MTSRINQPKEARMRKVPVAASAVAASVAFLAVVAPTAAEAGTKKELKLCWTTPGGGTASFPVVVDGPSARSRTLVNGTCDAMDVRRGKYKIVVPGDGPSSIWEKFDSSPNSVCGTPPANREWYRFDVMASVKRFKNEYQTYEVSQFGHLFTNVQKNKQTKVNFRVTCYSQTNNQL